MGTEDTISKALDPKLRGPFVLLAALGAGAVVVLFGYSTFSRQVRSLAREEFAADWQANRYKHERFMADIATVSASVEKIEQRLSDLERQAQEVSFRARLDKERRERGTERR